ncbi:MAG: sarcosine oxidase subunit gamma [Hyphomicrobiales bacterium]
MASATQGTSQWSARGMAEMPPGIRLSDPAPASIAHLAQPIGGSSLSILLSTFGIAQLPRPGRTASAGAGLIFGIAPQRWWLVREQGLPADSKQDALVAGFGIAVDVSDAWSRFRIAGKAMLDLLAKGSTLDLDPRAFAEGTCALAAFAQLHTLLHRAHGAWHFDLYCGRSYARALHEWLIEAAAEFGCETLVEKGGATPQSTT